MPKLNPINNFLTNLLPKRLNDFVFKTLNVQGILDFFENQLENYSAETVMTVTLFVAVLIFLVIEATYKVLLIEQILGGLPE